MDVNNSSSSSNNSNNPQHIPRAVNQWAGSAGRAFTSFAQNITTRRYTLPDKSVASQVLMYRQLLHTKCRPGLKLSRDYQGTPAQKAVLHMPWWEEGIETSRKMIISYDNLITRLWLNGAIMPHAPTGNNIDDDDDDDDGSGGIIDKVTIDTLVDEKGLPPVPHEYWVDRLGFQQTDPVTDFRSGGVLSLAMMVHIVESCPEVHERFVAPTGDASVLPFGITCINVTDMLAKFCMLAKSVDRMDALLSQKPFWRMFADPSSILALQELSLDMLADVVVELGEERKIPGYVAHDDNNTSSAVNMPGDSGKPGKVTVFDFSLISERTEQRVERDLLGCGPKSVEELRAIRVRLKQKYGMQLEKKKQRAQQQLQKEEEQRRQAASESNTTDSDRNQAEESKLAAGVAGIKLEEPRKVAGEVINKATTSVTNVASGAGTMAAGMFAKMKIAGPKFNPLRKEEINVDTINAGHEAGGPNSPDLMKFSASEDDADDGDDGDWIQSPANPPTDAIEHFSIADDDDLL